ncbi:MAG: SpoIIE family protein phosphatase [Betaproteobacteria bacterium]|nr:SpoIIE family protein phosphatase [Betaproteobacteria bacterium]
MTAVLRQVSPEDTGTPAGDSKALSVLVVDDSPAILRLLESFIAAQGHDVRVATDGLGALRTFLSDRPDMVIMDVVMPNMDGIEATQRLRAESSGRWVPIILMSTLGSEADVIRGLEAGADDYLTKPVHLAILQAKIASFQRIVSMQREIVAQTEALQQLQDEQTYEHELAASLIENIVHRDGLTDDAVRWQVLPSARFSGDVVAAARSPDGRLYALLGDATGHGLAASVSLIPALQVFYGMVRKGLPLQVLAREMNQRLREQLPVGRYFAAVIISLDERSRRLEYWNGGMPPGFLLGLGGEIREQIVSAHVALGILPDASFEDDCAVVNWSPGDVLLLYSDGLIEAEGAARVPYGVDRLRRAVRESRGLDVVATVMASLHEHLGCTATHDDASILAVDLK